MSKHAKPPSRPQRPRGRPRLVEEASQISTVLSGRMHEALIRRAERDDQSVSAFVRQLVIRELKSL